MKKFLFLIVVILSLVYFFYIPETHMIDKYKAEDNYLLAISVCPPWKTGMKNFCEPMIKDLKKIFEERLGIPQKNILTIVNREGTYQGVEKAFEWLKNQTNSKSRVFIHINAHGGPISNEDGSNAGLVDSFLQSKQGTQMFVLWTEDIPITVGDAIENKEWIMASGLREMLNEISAEKIVTIDACHAGIAEGAFLNYNSNVPMINRREAFIFSSTPAAISAVNFVKDQALFSAKLIKAIKEKDNLESAFKMARWKTLKASILQAIDEETGGRCLIHGGDSLCIQIPLKNDPKDLLKQVVFSEHKNQDFVATVEVK
jgi:hypothetical protein